MSTIGLLEGIAIILTVIIGEDLHKSGIIDLFIVGLCLLLGFSFCLLASISVYKESKKWEEEQ